MVLTASSVEASRTAIAFEMLCLLVVDEDLEVVEVALAVIAPWALEEVLDFGVLTLLFGHGCCDGDALWMMVRKKLVPASAAGLIGSNRAWRSLPLWRKRSSASNLAPGSNEHRTANEETSYHSYYVIYGYGYYRAYRHGVINRAARMLGEIACFQLHQLGSYFRPRLCLSEP